MIEWLCVLGIAPFDHVYPLRLPPSRCGTCTEKADPLSGTFVRLSITGRALVQCTRCGERWVELTNG